MLLCKVKSVIFILSFVQPVTFEIQCLGVKPEIQLDRKLIQFEKVLLHRRTEQKLELFNPTQLPISWRVTGMENMGDEFNLNESFGVIEPFQLGCPSSLNQGANHSTLTQSRFVTK